MALAGASQEELIEFAERAPVLITCAPDNPLSSVNSSSPPEYNARDRKPYGAAPLFAIFFSITAMTMNAASDRPSKNSKPEE